MDPLVIVFGLGIGILVGLTGMGGGSLMTPILIIVFGYNPVTAVGTDLAYGAVTKTVGGWRHFRQRNGVLPARRSGWAWAPCLPRWAASTCCTCSRTSTASRSTTRC